ncbi:hypothetical protein [Fibrobacter sp. UWB11]|uniref:hypothetical protein n=1 Tax=Fibrobacter sp. UWB11 TaxID=1896202 RepID=UPI00092B06C9|nr:hypothetical protein [Fibrobacter sp. UWB11]SIO46330.1 hypothetical protein SAMN05720758_3081 [Fibrobacter sp. UWB11]
MRALFGLILLVLATALFAETQEEAYYRALKFEEAGDISAALQAFEEAAALPGEYTEEIQGIIRDYKAALGKSEVSDTISVSFWDALHVAGELGLYGLHYKETGMDKGEMGGDLFLNVNPYLDYISGDWAHTFAASVQGDYFLNNNNMPVLDTNDWNIVLGLEYTLLGKSMLLDLGYDFNIEGKSLSSDFYVWFEKELFRFEKQRVGAVAWAYYQTSGPMSLALYGSWHRTAAEGLNGTVYVGAKYEADSVFDYKAYFHSYDDVINDTTGTLTADDLMFRYALGKWLGPIFRSRISYKFKNRITVEGKLNLYYRFAVGGPDSEFEKIRKFSGTWGATVSWKHWKLNYYLGVDRRYTRLYLPRFYKKIYTESSTLTQLKLGVKWDF